MVGVLVGPGPRPKVLAMAATRGCSVAPRWDDDTLPMGTILSSRNVPLGIGRTGLVPSRVTLWLNSPMIEAPGNLARVFPGERRVT
jgi:hypothetical protein